ncbi:MAG: protein-L-isoaspartate(D-aspartate) O-methyltransferase [archaeon]
MSERLEERRAAVDRLIAEGILKSNRVIRAMLAVPREEFLTEDMKQYAYADTPLPIGCGQTTSALHMTAMICEYTKMSLGLRVLEVGGGSGYMSCVYAEIVASTDSPKDKWGHVWSVEIIKELAERAKKGIERTGYGDRVSMIHGDASEGLRDHSPYDVIAVTSAAPNVPDPLKEQLAPGGTLLIPVGNTSFYQQLLRIKRSVEGRIEEENLGSVAFVPLRGKRGWPS